MRTPRSEVPPSTMLARKPTLTNACGPWRGGGPPRAGHPPSACACGSHGAACGQACLADKCVSRRVSDQPTLVRKPFEPPPSGCAATVGRRALPRPEPLESARAYRVRYRPSQMHANVAPGVTREPAAIGAACHAHGIARATGRRERLPEHLHKPALLPPVRFPSHAGGRTAALKPGAPMRPLQVRAGPWNLFPARGRDFPLHRAIRHYIAYT